MVLKLDPEAVRRRASTLEDCIEIPTKDKNAVSFLVGEKTRDAEQLARIVIFCDSGTITTCRVLHGVVRHVFRRNVSSLDLVERLLKSPANLTSIDPSLGNIPETGGRDSSSNKKSSTGNPQDTVLRKKNENKSQLPPAVQAKLDLVDVGLAILLSEKDQLQRHLESLEPPPPATLSAPTTATRSLPAAAPAAQPTKENAAITSKPSLAQGMEFQFSLPPTAMEHVDQCLQDINKMNRLVKSVATNGKGSVFLYGNGGVAYTPNIPRGLYHKLSQLRHAKTGMSGRPDYVSLGTRDRFFVTFHDGTWSYKGPKGLDRELKKAAQPPLSVAFGSSYDTFFIVFHDGSWSCQGREIPDELAEKLSDRGDRPDLVCVNLGPSGEWFLKAKNGRYWWGGVSEDMEETIKQLLDTGHTVRFLDFGEDESYFISYD